jgi:hypothetical protein
MSTVTSIRKDFTPPATATTGLQGYDLEAERKKRAAKASARPDRTVASPAGAENELEDYDEDGDGRKAPGDGASKGKRRGPKAQRAKPQPAATHAPSGNDDDEDDERGDAYTDDVGSTDSSNDDDDDDDELSQARKVSPDAADPNGGDAIDVDPNARGYGKDACLDEDVKKRQFTQGQRDSAAASGAALPDGSYPIHNTSDLKNAIQAFGRAKNKAKVKAHIESRARSLGASSLLPESWKADGGDITKLDDAQLAKFFETHRADLGSLPLMKGVCDVSSLAALIYQLKSMADGEAFERSVEGDDSTVPEQLRDAAANLLGVLSAMASEEQEELNTNSTAEDVMADAAGPGAPVMSAGLYRIDVSEFAKALRDQLGLAKIGARNSKADLAIIQKVHDAACELGAACKGPHEFDGESVQPQEISKMATGKVEKTDTIAAEGNKRGSAVSDPKPGPGPATQSSNAEDAERTSDQSQEAPASDAKKRKSRMNPDAMKRKGRPDMDMDDDDDDDMDDDSDSDDDDDDEDAPPAKKSKKVKAAKAEEAEFMKMIATVTATAVASALSQVLGKASGGGTEVIPPVRGVAPSLMLVGKDGSVSKLQSVNVDELKKSVQPATAAPLAKWGPELDHRDQPTGRMVGDNDTATLIKAIHAGGPTFRISPHEIPGRG